MKWGIRKPSLKKRIAARTSFSRFMRDSLGFKAPRGFGWFTNPRRAAYNRIYNRTTVKADNLIALGVVLFVAAAVGIARFVARLLTHSGKVSSSSDGSRLWPRCRPPMVVFRQYFSRGQDAAVLGRAGLNTIIASIQHEDSGGQEPECA
jgi:hypothetical protein